MVVQIPTENSVGKSKDCGSDCNLNNILVLRCWTPT